MTATVTPRPASLAEVQALIPKPATTPPLSEKTGAGLGSVDVRFAKEDHQHPRLTSTTYTTLDAQGQAAVPFTRTFVNKPGLNFAETDGTPNTMPLSVKGLGWIQDGNGLYTGVNIQGQRAQALPQLTPVSGILTAVITGVNSIVTALTGFNVFGGNASGASVSVIAVARSDMASN